LLAAAAHLLVMSVALVALVVVRLALVLPQA
jgi:hypothetical protein